MYRLRCKFCGMVLEPEEVCRCQMTGKQKKNTYKRRLASILNKKVVRINNYNDSKTLSERNCK